LKLRKRRDPCKARGLRIEKKRKPLKGYSKGLEIKKRKEAIERLESWGLKKSKSVRRLVALGFRRRGLTLRIERGEGRREKALERIENWGLTKSGAVTRLEAW
jgi:hypothetical protein